MGHGMVLATIFLLLFARGGAELQKDGREQIESSLFQLAAKSYSQVSANSTSMHIAYTVAQLEAFIADPTVDHVQLQASGSPYNLNDVLELTRDFTITTDISGVVVAGAGGHHAVPRTCLTNLECYRRVLTVASGATVVVEGLVIHHGAAYGWPGTHGVANYNLPGGGGGIANFGSLTMSNCQVYQNAGNNIWGGGIMNVGTLTMTDCTIQDNSVGNGEGYWGGGVYNLGQLVMTTSTVTGNQCNTCGAGVYTADGGITSLISCTVAGNLVQGSGNSLVETADSNICTASGGITTISTLVPTPQPTWPLPATLAPTAAPSAPPVTTASISNTAISAVGDPHLTNVHGERFDLMQEGKHNLIRIPRKRGETTLLRVDAVAKRLGGQCADIYFQELNVTGKWVDAKQKGGFRYHAQEPGGKHAERARWIRLGPVKLKVAHGHTHKGVKYLNFYVKNLGHAGYIIGGLLGEDDHTKAEKTPNACVHLMAL